jgi:hypothetical protein
MSGKKIMVMIVENSSSADQRFEFDFFNVPYVTFPYKDW